MTHPQSDFSSEQFADLLHGELVSFFEAKGTRFERLFFFPGQDPFHRGSPADAIASLYWSLPVSARKNMREGMISVLAKRIEVAPPELLTQIIFAIGLIHEPQFLTPFVRVLGQRTDRRQVLDQLYEQFLSVVVGFGPEVGVLQAVRRLVGQKNFPDYLAYDAFECLLGDGATLWSANFCDLLPRMEVDYRPDIFEEISNRIRLVAETLAERIDLHDIAQGINDLLSEDQILALYTTRRMPRRDIQTMLLYELLLSEDAPFALSQSARGALNLVSRDGKRSIAVQGGLEDLSPLFQPLLTEPLDCFAE